MSFHREAELGVTILTNRSFKDIKMYGKSAEYVSGLVDKIWKILEGQEIETLPQIVKTTIITGSYSLEDQSLTIKPKNDSTYTIHLSEAPVTRMIPNTPITIIDTASINFLQLADALENKRYWRVAKYGTGEMRFVCYSGLMAYGMKQMKKQTGEVESIIPYKIAKNHGLMRMKGAEGSLDLIVYLNKEGEMQGIFEHGFYDFDHPQAQLAYVIDDNTLFVDGLPYGETSCKIIVEDDLVSVVQFDREVKLTKSE